MTEMCFGPTPSSASLLSPPLSSSWREREGGREGRGREGRERERGSEGGREGRDREKAGGSEGGREGREREKEGGREGEREGRRVTETSLKKPQNGNVRPNLKINVQIHAYIYISLECGWKWSPMTRAYFGNDDRCCQHIHCVYYI